MSNEEIEKRFLFDLEVSFSKLHRSDDYYAFIGDFQEIDNFAKVLLELGFTKDIPYTSLGSIIKGEYYVVLTIEKSDKSFVVGHYMAEYFTNNLYEYNKIPEYIYEYSLGCEVL